MNEQEEILKKLKNSIGEPITIKELYDFSKIEMEKVERIYPYWVEKETYSFNQCRNSYIMKHWTHQFFKVLMLVLPGNIERFFNMMKYAIEMGKIDHEIAVVTKDCETHFIENNISLRSLNLEESNECNSKPGELWIIKNGLFYNVTSSPSIYRIVRGYEKIYTDEKTDVE